MASLDVDESDIEVSDVSSVSDSSDDEVGGAGAGDAEGEDDSDSDDSSASGSDSDVPVWGNATHPVQVDAFTQRTDVNHQLGDNSGPINYFHLLQPEWLWQTIADETNRYAEQKNRKIGPC